MTQLHPATGLYYVVAIPSAPAFAQVRICYQALASKTPWLQVVSQEDFPASWQQCKDDQRAFFLLWGFTHQALAPRRNARAALVFSEPLGPFDVMLPQHLELLADTWKWLRRFDCVFLHTPEMVRRMSQLATTKAYLLPVGWDPCMGRPDFARHKVDRLVYWGSPAGRRIQLMPALQALLGDKFQDASGCFGAELSDVLQGARAGLYIGHSAVPNASTFRIWQSLVTSAPLIAEGSDWWPLTSQRHYLQIPEVKPGNVSLMAQMIGAYASMPGLIDLSRSAWEEVAPYFTIEHCVRRYLVPASLEIAETARSDQE